MKKNRLTAIGLAAIAATVIACGSGGDGENVTVSSGDSGAAGQSSPAAPEGPKTAKMGQTITVDASLIGKGDQVVAYTVAKGAQLKSPSEYEKPDNGVFYGVTLTVVVQAGSEFANGSDISLVASDGTVYEPTFTTHKGGFEGADLKAGQKKSGLVVFDIPKAALKGSKIQVKSFWDDEPYGYWTI